MNAKQKTIAQLKALNPTENRPLYCQFKTCLNSGHARIRNVGRKFITLNSGQKILPGQITKVWNS